jgi:hypothetical protein
MRQSRGFASPGHPGFAVIEAAHGGSAKPEAWRALTPFPGRTFVPPESVRTSTAHQPTRSHRTDAFPLVNGAPRA